MHLLPEPVRPKSLDPLADQLKREGYLVLKGAMARTRVAALYGDLKERFERTPFCRGEFYGLRTKRFGSLLRRSIHTSAFVMHDTILRLADQVLGPYCDTVQLNLTQALEIHPGEVRQVPHRDEGMYRAPHGQAEYLFNVMWPFTDYTAENGATLIYPRSNHWRLDADHHFDAPIAIEMSPGDALIFLGSTLHGAGANRSLEPRTGMIIGYSLGWLKPYENQWLAYPPHIAKNFSPELARLVGYCQHKPNLGNYEGQCPSVLLGDNVCDFLEARDDVLDDQRERLVQFRESQLSSPTPIVAHAG